MATIEELRGNKVLGYKLDAFTYDLHKSGSDKACDNRLNCDNPQDLYTNEPTSTMDEL